MTVETATYINGFNTAWPLDNDEAHPRSEGDDHLRLMKSAIKATWPNITGPVLATQQELNRFQGQPTGTFLTRNASTGILESVLHLPYTSIVNQATDYNLDTSLYNYFHLEVSSPGARNINLQNILIPTQCSIYLVNTTGADIALTWTTPGGWTLLQQASAGTAYGTATTSVNLYRVFASGSFGYSSFDVVTVAGGT